VTADNVPKLQAEIARAVAKAIGTTARSELSTHVVKPEAYDLYLRASPYYGVEPREATDRAIRLLESAVAIDPGFAPAHAALTTAYRVRGLTVEPERAEEWVGKAMMALQKSLSLDPNLSEAYVSRGSLLWSRRNGWAHERAVEDYRHALSLNSNLAEAHHQLANVYNHVGLLDKAEREIHKALELDPLNVGARFRAGINLLYRGKYDDSLATIRDSENFNPPLWVFQTSFALQHLRRVDEAQKRVAAMLAERPDDREGVLTAMQALLAADAGDTRQAEDKIGEALERGKVFQHFHHITYAVASAYALLHKQEQALNYLQLTADDGFPCYPLFEHDSNLNNLRNNPRFEEFMARQKTQWKYFQSHL
jgi:tetratricopeptide (TPR) repeat protein